VFTLTDTWVLECHKFFNIDRKWLWSLTDTHRKHLGVELPFSVTSITSYRCHLSRKQSQLQWDLVFMGIHSVILPISLKTTIYHKKKIFPSFLGLGPFANFPACSQVHCQQGKSAAVRWIHSSLHVTDAVLFGCELLQSYCASFYPHQSKSKASAHWWCEFLKAPVYGWMWLLSFVKGI